MIPSLSEFASEAMDSISAVCDGDDHYDAIDALSDLDKIRYRYNHADCDDFAFALHVLMGWDIVAVNSPTYGPMHRLVVMPDDGDAGVFNGGAYVDAGGYVDNAILCKRYKVKKLEFVRLQTSLGPTISDDDELRRVFSMMTYLPDEPFANPVFVAKLRTWIESGHYFDEPVTTTSTVSSSGERAAIQRRHKCP